jgi:uncharacterized BrkB/YihY/UPF0761 family membrane protein
MLSYTITAGASGFGQEVLEELGIDSPPTQALVLATALILTLALDVGIMWLVLTKLGGIRPARRATMVGAAVGAVAIGLLKVVLSTVVSWSLDKPEYGAFALPVAILVVLWFQSMALYGAASLTAGRADLGDRPLR